MSAVSGVGGEAAAWRAEFEAGPYWSDKPTARACIEVLAENVDALAWRNDRLRSALTVAHDFIAYHPAVTGKPWPLLLDLITSALASDETGTAAARPSSTTEGGLVRNEPWRWYCRNCGAEGEDVDESARTAAAISHVRTGHEMTGKVVIGASSGRLLHAWPIAEYLGPPATCGVLWPLSNPPDDAAAQGSAATERDAS